MWATARGPLQGVLIVSDIDGTLMTSGYEISERNLEAIRRFKDKGGAISLATGRSIVTGGKVFDSVAPNVPCIALNGGMLCEYGTNRVFWEEKLPPEADNYIMELAENFPDLAVEIFTANDLFLLQKNEYSERHIKKSKIHAHTIQNQRLPADKFKVLFMGNATHIAQLQHRINTDGYSGIRCFLSSANYLEFVPAQVNKGWALQKLISLLQGKIRLACAIGDYYNDLEMIQSAQLGAAPANAIDEIKACADLHVCDCAHGAVADLIEYVEAHFSN